MISCRPISLDDLDVGPLADQACAEGYVFVERMRRDWKSGDNRFDGPGERLIGAFEDETLVGFCGLNRDPYTSENAGRIRHLYVDRGYRRSGVARALVAEALDGASASFPRIRLRATAASTGFYERLGFLPVDEPEATHTMPLR